MLRVGDLQRSIDFYTSARMKLLRTTDRPDQKYTLAFVGYGDEREHAVLELTYNYGVERYEMGTAFGHIAIAVPDAYAACERIRRRAATSPRSGPVKEHDRHRVRDRSGRLQDRAYPVARVTRASRQGRAAAPA